MIRRRGETGKREEGLCQHKEMAIEIGEAAAAVEGIYGAMFHNLALSPPSLARMDSNDRARRDGGGHCEKAKEVFPFYP